MTDEVLAPARAVLLVDDQEAVRNVLRMLLVRGGYTVLDAPSGVQAAALSRGHPAPIDAS